LPPAGLAAGDARGGAVSGRKVFADLLKQRILVLDGAMGTMIQALKLDEEGYRGARVDAGHRAARGVGRVACEPTHPDPRLSREAASLAEKEDGPRRFVAGALGPTNRTASI